MPSRRGQYFLEFFFFAAFALIGWLASYDFATPIPLYRYGADGWPKGIVLCLFISSVFLLLYRLLRLKMTMHGETQAVTPHVEGGVTVRLTRRATIYAVPMLYAALLPYLGFYVATFIFLPLYTWLLGETKTLRLLLVTTCTAVCITVLFSRYLYVSFPMGSWLLFYDINSFLGELLYK